MAKPMTSVFYDVIRLESVRGRSNVLIEGHFWRFLGNMNPNMLSAIVWTPKRHFLTSQHVFWAIVRQNPSTNDFSRRVREKIKIKREALYFTYFARRSLTADWHKFWVTCSSRGRIIDCAKFYRNQWIFALALYVYYMRDLIVTTSVVVLEATIWAKLEYS